MLNLPKWPDPASEFQANSNGWGRIVVKSNYVPLEDSPSESYDGDGTV